MYIYKSSTSSAEANCQSLPRHIVTIPYDSALSEDLHRVPLRSELLYSNPGMIDEPTESAMRRAKWRVPPSGTVEDVVRGPRESLPTDVRLASCRSSKKREMRTAVTLSARQSECNETGKRIRSERLHTSR